MDKNPYLSIDQQMVGDIYTSPELMDNITILCDDFGSRFGGTEGERLAAEFMRDKMIAYGLSNVHLEPFEYEGWRRGTVSLEIISPIKMTIPCISLPHSPPADFEATLCDMGDGAPADFDKRANEIKGKIVMANSKIRPPGVDRWIHRNEKYGRSLMAGAEGFIFINHYPGYGPATGGIGNAGGALKPGVSVSMEDGAFLQRLIRRKGEVRVRIKSTDVNEPMTSWNVVGDIVGSKNPETVVMLGCHYDGHDISQGAGDPISGAVAVMEAARVLKQYAGDLGCTVRFALWGVEEIGLIGSNYHVAQHMDELDNMRFYFNMDGAGASGDKGVMLNEWDDLVPVFEAWSAEMALGFGVDQSVNAHSDHFPFLLAGVPTGGMEGVGETRTGRGYGHTRYDTLDKIDQKYLREAAAMASRLALRMANHDAWPVARRSSSDVEALFEGAQYEEASAFRNAYAAHVAAAKGK